MMSQHRCLFCDIVAGTCPARKVYEDDLILIFEDIAPQAPVHLLLIPKQHLTSLNDIDASNSSLIAHILDRAAFIAREQGFADDGYRVVTNCGRKAGQSVFHLHFHLLAGRQFRWPPG